MVFNALLGGTAAFKQVLAVVTHSRVIAALGAAIRPIQMMQGTITMGGVQSRRPGAVLETSPIRAMLGSISVFTLWGIVVTAIGLGVLYHRKTRNITRSCAHVISSSPRSYWVLGDDGRTERWISE